MTINTITIVQNNVKMVAITQVNQIVAFVKTESFNNSNAVTFT